MKTLSLLHPETLYNCRFEHKPKFVLVDMETWTVPASHVKKNYNSQQPEDSFQTSRDEVVDEKRRRVAVLGREHFAVGRRVREGDFLLGEVTAVHEGAPENIWK